MRKDLVKRLRANTEMWDHDYELQKEAANYIEKLKKSLENEKLRRSRQAITLTNILLKKGDHIEKLEAALREIAEGYATEWSLNTFTTMLDVAQILSEKIHIARKALEGKDGPVG